MTEKNLIKNVKICCKALSQRLFKLFIHYSVDIVAENLIENKVLFHILRKL